MMEVSVIIPVYNAADFVADAVDSALAQPETAEVVLVEDGSPDDSLAVCRKLAAANSKVHLYRHPDGKNHGAGATRNLAIRKSRCEYVAFLDADDYFLPGRFSVAGETFTADPAVDGVYEAIDAHFETDAAAQMWEALNRPTRITMKTAVPPESLFAALLEGQHGGFSIDGLTVRRALFEKTGWFDAMRLHQDTAMMMKMAAVGCLVPGRLDEPVAKFRVHGNNRWAAVRPPTDVYQTKLTYWYTLWQWSRSNLAGEQDRLVLNRFLNHLAFGPRLNVKLPRFLRKRLQLILALVDCPTLVNEWAYWQRFMPRMLRFSLGLL